MTSPRTQLFWFVKVMEMKVAEMSSGLVYYKGLDSLSPHRCSLLNRHNRVVSLLYFVYFLDINSKENYNMLMLQFYCFYSLLEAVEIMVI